MGRKVLIPQGVATEGEKYLLDRGYEIVKSDGISVEALKAAVVDCDAILARTTEFPAAVLEAGKKLKVIARHGVGINNIDVATATRLGIQVTFTPLANSNTVAEQTISMLLALSRNLLYIDKMFRQGNWGIRDQVKGFDLEGKTLGIAGLGRIGSLVAKKAGALDMNLIGYDPFIDKSRIPANMKMVNSLEEIFAQSDFVTLHMPYEKKLVGKALFDLMKPTAYFINLSRGEVVFEQDLVEALRNKKIAGAALDVFEPEPPDIANNPLFTMENVILTPHNAALTVEATIRMAVHAAQGIDEVLSGKTPTWPANKLDK
ncbi:MAG TPA: hydroxyacid dehydrogenase [Negativicutes bacterium]|nr:hydroxyacid dehydrogenase [Negativicutes bacterium]